MTAALPPSIAVVLLADLMALVDSTITNVGGPSVRADLGGGESLLQWLGAGYTLASGSSSSASAAVAHKLGLVDANVTVHMPGGEIGIEIAPDFAIRMTGPVTHVAEGTLQPQLFTTKV